MRKLFFLVVANIANVVLSVTMYETLNDNVDQTIMMKLIGKLDILEGKVTKLEKNELQMKESIRALIETNAKLRIENLELGKRVGNVETELNHTRKTGDDIPETLQIVKRVENIETDLKDKGNMANDTVDRHESSTQEKRQTQPNANKTAFTAYLDHPIKSLGMDQPIVYNQVLLNDGNGYNSNSGIFTVPFSGVYLFSWAATARKLAGEHAYDIWVKLQVNGAHQIGCVAESRDDFDDNQGSNTVLLRVNQGDQVWTAHYSAYPDIYGNDNERTTSFSGVLMYEDL